MHVQKIHNYCADIRNASDVRYGKNVREDASIESVRLGQRLSRVVLDYILYLYVSVRG